MKTFFLAAGLLFAAAAFAQQYKWVDPDGRVRYGDQPPPGVKATPLRPPPTGAATPAPAAKGAKDKPLSPEAAFRQRQLEAQKQADTDEKTKQETALKKENCALAQANLRMFESGDRISQTDSKGERYYLDDDQRARGASQARQQVQQLCN